MDVLKRAWAGCFMAKTDVKSAFRIIPIHPNDYPLLAMKWENLYYFDRCLPMGCSFSCALFEAFSTALEWLALHRLGASGVLHILDDFLFIAESEEKCQGDLNIFPQFVRVSRGSYGRGKNGRPSYRFTIRGHYP